MKTSLFQPEKLASDFVLFRRASFFGAIIGTTGLGAWLLWRVFEPDGVSTLEWIQLLLFILLFQQVATGFWLALFGFLTRLAGGDRAQIAHSIADEDLARAPSPTAIVVPIYNEDVPRVFAGVEAMWRGLEESGGTEGFDLFILSDSNRPESWIREETAWFELCRRLGTFGRIFYRKRRVSRNGKSGNVADFCRRWGARYRYMVVLDADSVVTGRLLRRLAAMMDRNPHVGLIQTAPQTALGRTPFRRMQQFAARLYTPLFAAGSNYWHLFGGNYWGHNAIIRLRPFIEHCDLPDLPEPDAKRRHIFSHDTVEAALMRKAGYDVWFAYGEEGSYEEGPPNLSDSLARDQRWCMGNLQHFWFLFAPKIDFANRFHIWMGVMAYSSSLMWLVFLVVGTIDLAIKQRFSELAAVPGDAVFRSGDAVQILLTATLALLFVPKFLAMLAALPQARRFGGAFGLFSSTIIETVTWTLLAPALMLFYTRFVVLTLMGLPNRWESQNRSDDKGLGFWQSFRIFWFPPACGVLACVVMWYFARQQMLLLSPILAGWLLAPAIAWWTSQPGLGDWARCRRLFVTAEELPEWEPGELAAVRQVPSPDGDWTRPSAGLGRVVAEPAIHAVHLSLLRVRRPAEAATAKYREALRERLLADGPASLDRREQFAVLWDGDSLRWLHRELWSRPMQSLHPWWQQRLRDLCR